MNTLLLVCVLGAVTIALVVDVAALVGWLRRRGAAGARRQQ
jgi:hypothetical protein